MAAEYPEEKVKPFRLVKYFTFSSLIVIFIGTIALSMFSTHWARRMVFEKNVDYAHSIIENLNHQVFLQALIPIVVKYGKVQLGNKEQFEHMDKVVRGTLHSFKVEMVTIYGMNNVISYSFNKELVGQESIGSSDYKKAIAGKWSSKLVQRGSLLEIMLGIPQEIKIITFAPIRAEEELLTISGPVLGVVEIVQDLSKDYQTIFRFQTSVIINSSAVMGILFLVLLLVVKRGERITQQRTQERLQLEEQLRRSEHLSSLGEMAAGISHEIRNPLGIIRSSAELLKKKMNGFEPSNRIPDVIVEESNRLNDIITDFFNFAKPRRPNLIPCRVDEILEKNITFLSSQANEQGYRIRTDYGPELPEISGDSDMLYQAFLNLLINAMQAMPGGGQINIKTESANGAVKILIEDEGEGVPENLKSKIWDPFFTTKEKGTGLGLGIVKNIIESHGGDIRIFNRPDRGSRVHVNLPCKKRSS
jgi:signal transduction histidine kinase